MAYLRKRWQIVDLCTILGGIFDYCAEMAKTIILLCHISFLCRSPLVDPHGGRLYHGLAGAAKRIAQTVSINTLLRQHVLHRLMAGRVHFVDSQHVGPLRLEQST